MIIHKNCTPLLSIFITITAFSSEYTYEMNWLWKNGMFLTQYNHNTVSFAIVFRGDIVDQLPIHLLTLCKMQKSNTENTFTYTHDTAIEIPAFSNSKQSNIEQEHYNPCYHVHTPLIQHGNYIKHISKEELSNFLETRSIAWYTGAGISATVVPTMSTLEKSLGIVGTTENKRSFNLVMTTLQNPERIATTMHSFYEQCLNAKPTNAHKAIAKYTINKKNCIVFTENLDMLHEHTGITPKRVKNPVEFMQDITPAVLQKIDAFLCVGLSHDDRGLLGYYKHHNPQGIIIALCLEQPTYLSETDYFFQQDAQTIIPQLIRS